MARTNVDMLQGGACAYKQASELNALYARDAAEISVTQGRKFVVTGSYGGLVREGWKLVISDALDRSISAT